MPASLHASRRDAAGMKSFSSAANRHSLRTRSATASGSSSPPDTAACNQRCRGLLSRVNRHARQAHSLRCLNGHARQLPAPEKADIDDHFPPRLLGSGRKVRSLGCPILEPAASLPGKKGLVLNIINKNSIGWAIAEAANNYVVLRSASAAKTSACSDGVEKLIEGRGRFRSFTIDFGNDEEYDRLVEDVKKGIRDDRLRRPRCAAFAPKEAMQGKFYRYDLARTSASRWTCLATRS